MKELKTNVSIKFTTIEEYREIERTLVSMGYDNSDSTWNNYNLKLNSNGYVYIDGKDLVFSIYRFGNLYGNNTYNSLKDFLA